MLGVSEGHLFSLALCPFRGMSSRRGLGPFEFLPCTSLALRLCRGKEARYLFLSHGSRALALCSLTPLSLQLWSLDVDSGKVQHAQE